MTDNPDDRQDADIPRRSEDYPESGHGRSGSGAPVNEDPTGDAEYRGAEDQNAGPIFVETPDGQQDYGRTTQ